jgi:hypothetical protein
VDRQALVASKGKSVLGAAGARDGRGDLTHQLGAARTISPPPVESSSPAIASPPKGPGVTVRDHGHALNIEAIAMANTRGPTAPPQTTDPPETRQPQAKSLPP